MATNKIEGNLVVNGSLSASTITGSAAFIKDADVLASADIQRSKLEQSTLQPFVIPITDFRVFDSFALLPAAGTADDLGLYQGTFGTNSPVLRTGDLKASNQTRYARCVFCIPPEYDDGETVNIRIHSQMVTTVSDNTATVDVECYEADKEAGISADLCTTAAQSTNSLTGANYDFTITSTSLAGGDILDIRIAGAVNDTATGTEVNLEIGSVEVLLDIRG